MSRCIRDRRSDALTRGLAVTKAALLNLHAGNVLIGQCIISDEAFAVACEGLVVSK